jgi:hypothetical protein
MQFAMERIDGAGKLVVAQELGWRVIGALRTEVRRGAGGA